MINLDRRVNHEFEKPLTTLLISSNLSFLTAKWMTSIPPVNGALFITVTILVSTVVAPLIASWLEEYRNEPLLPSFGQALNITASGALSNLICYSCNRHLTLFQTVQLGLLVYLSIRITKYALRQIT